ncbi:MAG: tRNA (adenosine(37)-N6)-threonylcarbamoyltransferase complex ATPase subunit type 1 TsaE [Myxococcales bacterium]|nr:tRNA (adenosine(37)-N6)-threonylcarbamoyltransferase complex ATPase subunit type 1 TsaE [Myxococcales bacterium]
MKVQLADEHATRRLGEALGRAAVAGDVLAIEGPLGAGKTCLAQGVARGLDVPPTHYVNSPTFAILQVHPGRVPFYHVDLYRVGDDDEALGLGLDEVIGTDGVALVEWPSRLPWLLPADHLAATLEPEGPGRRLVLTARGPRSTRWAAAFAAERDREFG